MKKLNKLAVKVLSVLLAIILLSGQSIFAETWTGHTVIDGAAAAIYKDDNAHYDNAYSVGLKYIYYLLSHTGGAFVTTFFAMHFAPKYKLRVGYFIVGILSIICLSYGIEIYFQNKPLLDLFGLLTEFLGAIIAVLFYRYSDKKRVIKIFKMILSM